MASSADVNRPWNDEEDMILGHTYLEFHHSNDHKSAGFWESFVNYFNSGVSTEKKCTIQDVHTRFRRIKTHVEKFNAIYATIEEGRPEDGEDVLLDAAKERFRTLSPSGREFCFENIWNLWKYAPFW